MADAVADEIEIAAVTEADEIAVVTVADAVAAVASIEIAAETVGMIADLVRIDPSEITAISLRQLSRPPVVETTAETFRHPKSQAHFPSEIAVETTIA